MDSRTALRLAVNNSHTEQSIGRTIWQGLHDCLLQSRNVRVSRFRDPQFDCQAGSRCFLAGRCLCPWQWQHGVQRSQVPDLRPLSVRKGGLPRHSEPVAVEAYGDFAGLPSHRGEDAAEERQARIVLWVGEGRVDLCRLLDWDDDANRLEGETSWQCFSETGPAHEGGCHDRCR